VPDSETQPSDGVGRGMNVRVLRGDLRADTYIYVPMDGAYEDLPAGLRDRFGNATPFLSFFLHEEKVLAQADAALVLVALREQGFYLQLPPSDFDDGRG